MNNNKEFGYAMVGVGTIITVSVILCWLLEYLTFIKNVPVPIAVLCVFGLPLIIIGIILLLIK